MTTITKLYLCIFALTLAQQLFEFSKWQIVKFKLNI